jgi:hypothetical protein
MPSYGYYIYITTPQGRDGLLFAQNAMDFASLGLILEQKIISERKVIGSVTVNPTSSASVNLYCMAIELALKSLALRSGATLSRCKDASHEISKMFSLIREFNVKIPENLDRKLNDDSSLKNRLFGTRYPVFEPGEVISYHKNYPEMIAEILEIPCAIPLQFIGGSALAELKKLVADLKTAA